MKKKLGVRVLTALAAGALGITLLSGGTASAGQVDSAPTASTDGVTASGPQNRCKGQNLTVYGLQNGSATSMTRILANICVASNGGNLRNAFIKDIAWATYHPFRRYYDRFVFQIRLERYNKVIKKRNCEFGGLLNTIRVSDGDYRCNLGAISTSRRGGWTADGQIAYDRKGWVDSPLKKQGFAGTGSIR